MADIALSSVGKIVEVGLAIKEAAETVKQNKEDCLEIKNRVLRVTGILKRLEETNMMDDQAMSGALEDLEETLRKALTLVTACQERHIVCLFCKAGDLSKQLRRVQDDIMNKMMLGVFATNVHVTIILTNIEGAPQPQNAGSSSTDTTSESRTETDIMDNNAPQAEISDTPFASSYGFREFSLAEVENATNFFSEDNLIGQGGFSTVYKGKLEDGQVVAIKRFNNNSPVPSHKLKANELHHFSKLENRNILKCLGYVDEVHLDVTHFCMVHEYMPNGDLEKINCGTRADWSSRLHLINGIAQAVCYIHGQRIVHMDLKPSNILLDSDMNAKIADFGISRTFDAETTKELTLDVMGTMGYMAPEYIYRGEISFKADVYAFGIILLRTIIGGMCKGDLPSAGSRDTYGWS